MENMIDFVNECVASVSYNESLASLLKNKIEDTKKKPFVGGYYNLTELCNPAQTYWTRISPKVEKTVALQKKLDWGTELHRQADQWLKTFPDFVVNEGTLDGAWVGIPGVRGRIDCRIGESIFEIKTKEELPLNAEEVLLKHPHDVEQLAFYSVLHPCHDEINYLIFIKDSSPFELRAFKVKITDLGKIKSLLKSRMSLLNKAIEEKNSLNLGKCRYHNNECQFQGTNMCHCEKLESLSTDQLMQGIELTLDEEMTKKLEEIRTKFYSSKKFYSTLNIITPRKHKFDVKSEWNPDKEKDQSKSYLGTLIKKLPIKLSSEERNKIFNSRIDDRLYTAYRWANLNDSTDQEFPIFPYLVKSNMSNSIQTRPNPYFLAELGILASNYGKTKGLIFIIYPNKDNFVQVFEITYKGIKEISAKTREIIDFLGKGDDDLFALPPCPSFMNDNGTCPLMEKCNSREGCGCVK
ncbi:MAG: hypothetical protein KKF48_05425 [Nanoarchaeota archaeon]|nr:hypothetical protein [Nanoarchaeota archaeon]MBU1028457.1 hypothetical protein [Nanoarchaeota archaeon]